MKDNIKIRCFPIDKMYPLGDDVQRNVIENLYFNSISYKSKIGIASDHSGFKAKQCMSQILEKYKIKFIDFGCYNEKNCDYNQKYHY